MTAPPDDVLDLLTAYVLGALEPAEVSQVHQLLEQQPELQRTLTELRATAQRLPYALADHEPPADLRRRALEHAVGRSQPIRSVASSAMVRWRWLALTFGGIAAVAVVVVLVTLVQLVDTRVELSRTAADLAAARAVQQQVVAIATEAQVMARLSGGSGRGVVLSAPAGATLLIANLPPQQPDRVYQLWRIVGDEAPISAATFTVDAHGYGFVTIAGDQRPPPGATLAVTDEPAPGSPGPTTPILIVGQLNST
ncbi:MAG TPA: anti-sigma factor [Roseiflexaceae bacterium]|nr:anti-sigma factor [Roseiflexaceae bacterium]HMP42775.1 anti-sigma factor [Roseiflexaceae bacterium]